MRERSSSVELRTASPARCNDARAEPFRDGDGPIAAAAVRDYPFPRWLLRLDLARPLGQLVFFVQRGSDDRHEHIVEMFTLRV